MGSSRQPNAGDLPRHIVSQLRRVVAPQSRVCVGLSGGRDSVVLLHIMVRCRAELGIALSALHVNHQISSHADDWAAFCEKISATLAVPLHVERVRVLRDSGKGMEAAARDARYAAFAAIDADTVVLAHHLDDQAETVLLQALRGAGLKGISGMPAVKQGRQKSIARPLLQVAASVLAAYAAHHKLDWIVDESNQDTRYFRNHLRHEVLPRIAVHAPQYRASLTRLAQHAAEAQQLLDELAEIDAKSVIEQERLQLEPLLVFSDARATNLLRYFFSRSGIPVPNAIQMVEILQQLRLRHAHARTEIKWANHALRCYAGRIHIDVAGGREQEAWRIPWRGETELVLPQGCGMLRLEAAIGAGLTRSALTHGPVTIRSRIGGERLRPDSQRPRRTLKNLLQEAEVPPWQRARLPLVFCGQTLVWAPGIGADASFAAGLDQDSISVTWLPNQP